MKNLILFPIFVLFIFACQTRQTNQIDATLKNYFDSSSIPSAIMGHIDSDGNTTWYAFGPSVWNGKDTVNADHIFRIYSMTKPIASVAAMQLVEKGLIGLDDPLNDLMPEMVSIPILDKEGELYHSDQTITLRQLLTHTAGFAYDFTSERLGKFKQPDNWEYEDKPRIFEPGTGWWYGTSTDWLGKVIEKISGKDLETYIREHITGPLNMNSTWFNVPKELAENIVSWGAKDSTGTFNEYSRIPETPVTYFSAGAGLFSSPNDYVKFLQCILNYGKYDGERILKRETVEMMLADNLPENIELGFGFAKSDRWGLGWAIEASGDEPFRPMGVVFWVGGANTFFTIDVNNNIAIVYFTQYFPLHDDETLALYKLYEKEVYTKIKK